MNRRRRNAIIGGLIALIVAALIMQVYLWWIMGAPTFQSTDPRAHDPVIARILGADTNKITFYAYDLSGFIDRQELWKIEGNPSAINRVIQELKIHPANETPSQFWRMKKLNFPTSMPVGASIYTDRGFGGNDRGEDGFHYFLLHDAGTNRCFVWVKKNF